MLILFCAIFYISQLNAWSHRDTDHWVDDFPECGGDTQSPIDIDTYSVNPNCPVDDHEEPTLKWNLKSTKLAYKFWNSGHAIVFIPYFDYTDFGTGDDEPIPLNTNENTIGKLQNNFVTKSGEHKVYCLDSVHWHNSLTFQKGSEHTINGQPTGMEMHFVHYSCDYRNLTDALAATPDDPYVLAVVAVLFEIGPSNPFIERMVQFNEYLMEETDVGTATVQYGFDIYDLIPNNIADFYYYKGSLTTPPCLETVRWHVATERSTVTREQLKYLWNYRDEEGYLVAPNYRPVQYNKNEVFVCAAKTFDGYDYWKDEVESTKKEKKKKKKRKI